MENISETIRFFFKVISKKIPSIFLLISVFFLTIVSYNHFNIKNVLIKGKLDFSYPKFRKLGRFKEAEDNISKDNTSLTQYLNYFQFIQNLTENDYTGKWKSDYPQLVYDNNYGNIEMKIFRANYEELYMELDEESYLKNCIRLDIIITDGYYSDRFINFNVTINITDLFQNQTNFENKNVLLHKENVITNVSYWEIIEKSYTKERTFSLFLNISRTPFIYHVNKMMPLDIEIPNLTGNITFEGNSTINFSTTVENKDIEQNKFWNYSFILSLILLFQTYHSVRLLFTIVQNTYIAQNISMLTIFNNIFWNSCVCLFHLFCYFSFEELSPQFFTPTLLYLVLFCIFEGRILSMMWISRNLHIVDQAQLKNKFFKFIFFFYLVLTVLNVCARYIFTSFFLLFLIYSTSWIPQIYANFNSGVKKPLSFSYIWSVTIGKLFFPFYLGLCPYNVLSLRPKPLEVCVLTITSLLQVGILYLQSYFGPKCIVPRFLKKAPYNYYIEVKDENREKFNGECIICLDSLLNISVQLSVEPSNNINLIEGDYFENDKKALIKRYFKRKFEKLIDYFLYSNVRSAYMITPCNHIFHSECLEKWIEKKLECPFCRSKLPPLE